MATLPPLTSSILKAIAMLGSAQGISTLCSVVRTKVIAICLGTLGVGLNTILVNASNLISGLTLLNLRDSSVRDLSLPTDPLTRQIKIAVVRRWALILGLLGAAAMILFSPALSYFSFSTSTAKWWLFSCLSPAVFCAAYSAGEFSVMQANGKLKKIAKVNVTAGIAATALSILLILTLGIHSIVIIINLYFIAIAICTYIWREKTATPPTLNHKLVWQHGKSFLTLGFTLSVAAMLTTLMNYIFAAFLSSEHGEKVLGIYQSGFTLINSYIGVIFAALTLEYYPRLTRNIGRKKLASTIMAHESILITAVILPVAVIFISLSPFLISLLYSPNFRAVAPMVEFAALGTLFRGVSLCFAYRILAQGDSKSFLLTETASVAVGLLLNFLLFNAYGFIGLGVAYTLWYTFYALITAAVCRVSYKVILPTKVLTTTAMASAIIIATSVLKHLTSWWPPLLVGLPLSALLIFSITNKKTKTKTPFNT